jgi:hypothetical protein
MREKLKFLNIRKEWKSNKRISLDVSQVNPNSVKSRTGQVFRLLPKYTKK